MVVAEAKEVSVEMVATAAMLNAEVRAPRCDGSRVLMRYPCVWEIKVY